MGINIGYTILYMLLLAVLPIRAGAVVLEVRAGEIASGEIKLATDVKELSLLGSVNAHDLSFISSVCRSLRALDLSGVRIEACKGDGYVVADISEFPADVLPPYSLSGLSALSIELPAFIRKIGDGALLASSVEEIAIPSGVDSIGEGAFASCRSLRRGHVPSDVCHIGRYVFKDCQALEDVVYEAREVPVEAFSGCCSLRNVTLGKELERICGGAFAYTGIVSLDLSGCEHLDIIGDYAFLGCAQLEKLSLPSGISNLGEGFLFGCAALRDIALPCGIDELPAFAFTGAMCIGDISGILHEGISLVGAFSLSGMSGVRQVKLPSELKYIGDCAFEGWTGLRSVDAVGLGRVPSLGKQVWSGVEQSDIVLTVDSDVRDEFCNAAQWMDFDIRNIGESMIVDALWPEDAIYSFDASLVLGCLDVSADSRFSALRLHDIDGRCLLSHEFDGLTEFSVPVSLIPGKVYVLTVLFSDGKVGSAKLIGL